MIDNEKLFFLQGIVAFTFDDQAVARMEKQLKGEASHSKGIINEVFEVYYLYVVCLSFSSFHLSSSYMDDKYYLVKAAKKLSFH